MNARKLSPAMIRTLQRLDIGDLAFASSVHALERRGFAKALPSKRGVYYSITDAGRAALREIAS